MKKFTYAAAALAVGTSAAFAGGLDQPVEMAPVEIIEDTTPPSSSNAGLIVPLILLALIAVAVSGDN